MNDDIEYINEVKNIINFMAQSHQSKDALIRSLFELSWESEFHKRLSNANRVGASGNLFQQVKFIDIVNNFSGHGFLFNGIDIRLEVIDMLIYVWTIEHKTIVNDSYYFNLENYNDIKILNIYKSAVVNDISLGKFSATTLSTFNRYRNSVSKELIKLDRGQDEYKEFFGNKKGLQKKIKDDFFKIGNDFISTFSGEFFFDIKNIEVYYLIFRIINSLELKMEQVNLVAENAILEGDDACLVWAIEHGCENTIKLPFARGLAHNKVFDITLLEFIEFNNRGNESGKKLNPKTLELLTQYDERCKLKGFLPKKENFKIKAL